MLCVTAEYKTLCPGGEGFKPNPITVILEGQTTMYYNSQIANAHTRRSKVYKFFSSLALLSPCQTSTSARSCQACVREECASTPLAASSVNVKGATLSTQKPESVKVSERHMSSQVTCSSLALAQGRFYWEGN